MIEPNPVANMVVDPCLSLTTICLYMDILYSMLRKWEETSDFHVKFR